MNLDLMLAQLRGTLPSDVLETAADRADQPRCVQRRCGKPVAVKKNGEYAKSCSSCLERRARSCKRRREILVSQGGCRRCAYRPRLPGDFLCQRCREDRDAERAQKREDARDAAVIDEFAARPERAHRASNLDIGVSIWNGRSKPAPTAAYWSPLPDPDPPESQIWRWSLMNGRLHHKY